MYNLKGVFLDLYQSNETHAFLHKTDLNTEGTYGCEVSTEAPSFRTVKAEKELRVYVLPEEDPAIGGVQDHYQIGDEVNVTCSSGPSKPAPVLAWFINGKQAPSAYVVEYQPVNHQDGLQSSGLLLTFVVDPSHLWQGALSLQCTASLTQVYSKSSEELIVGDGTSGAEFQHVPHVPPGQVGPNITGGLPRYEVDDTVDVNCTSARSKQPAELKWYINDKEAPPEFLMTFRPIQYPDGLLSTKLGLKFRVHEDHFRNEEMRLKCTATLSKVINMSSVETVVGGNHRSSGLHVMVNTGSVSSQGGMHQLHWLMLKMWLVLLAVC